MLKINIRNRAYRTEFLLFSLYFIVSIAFLIFDEGVARYILNISLISLTYSILCFVPLKNKSIFFLYSTILYITYIVLSFLIIERKLNITVFNYVYSGFIISYILLFSDKGKRYLNFIYILFYCAVITIFLILLLGIEAEDVFSGSRNTISQFLVPIGAIFLLDERLKLGKVSGTILYLMIFISCVMSFGRSGILTSFLLLVSLFFYFERGITYKKLFFPVVSLFALVYFLSMFYVDIINTGYFDYLKDKGVDDGYRGLMKDEYISSLTIKNLFFGMDISKLPYISSFNNNPHNTYIFLHSNLGLLFLFFMSFVFVYWIKLLLYIELASFFALTAIILRLSTDSAADISILSIFFVSIMFFSKIKSSTKGSKSLAQPMKI